jgi:4-hydroxy-3-polyprenylbenzoate decarboxylase
LLVRSKELEEKIDARWIELGLSDLENSQPKPELFGYVIDQLIRQKQTNNS